MYFLKNLYALLEKFNQIDLNSNLTWTLTISTFFQFVLVS